MRGKRSKQYRKLMQQYGLSFGFREPYQVLLDAEIIQDAARFKMDLVGMLERTLHGQVKPMITQCSMRHLYTAEPKDEIVIAHAKGFERRRCDHHNLDQSLSTIDCLSSVINPKEVGTNKHRYIVATQDIRLRAHLRTIPAVPLIYLKRSVMILEPMADASQDMKDREDKQKFREGLVPKSLQARKRKRNDEEGLKLEELGSSTVAHSQDSSQYLTRQEEPRKRNKRGPKGPNPLSVQKKRPKNLPL